VTEWLENENQLLFSFEDMTQWIQVGEKKLTYNQTTEFADPDIFKVVNSSKVNYFVFIYYIYLLIILIFL